MYGLIIYGVFLESVSVVITEGSTVAPERQAKDGVYIGYVYIGCYDQVCLKKFENGVDVPQNATPDSCTASCKTYGFKIAALYNRTECACSCALNCLTLPENDNQCGLPCRGDVGRFCGGYFAASLYSILSTNTSNGQCGKNNETSQLPPGGNGNGKGNDGHDNTLFYVAAGVGCVIIIGVIIILSNLRKRDRRIVYSPRDHSRRWRAHAASHQNEERRPDEAHPSTDQPELPMRRSDETHSTSNVNSASRNDFRHTEQTTTEHSKVTVPVPDSNFYHVLLDDGEQSSERYSMMTDNAYAYADCRSYRDSFPRSAAFVHRQLDTPHYPDDDEVEHEMVNNELYAIAKK